MRSGSNAICDLLARNGLGFPGELFQVPPSAINNEPWLDAFERHVREHHSGGIFGSKMGHNHRAALDECLRAAIPGYRHLDDVLPHHRWVKLVRRDIILQAISLCRAESSNCWAVSEIDQTQHSGFRYDFFHVLSRIMLVHAGNLAWDVYFQAQGISPFVVVYEDFFEDLDRHLPALIDHLGGLPSGRVSLDMGQRFKVQRDTLSDEVRERFVSDFNRVGETSLIEEIGAPWNRWTRFFNERKWQSAVHDLD